MLTNDIRSATARLQRFTEPHNPTFPGYRRTPQPMPRPRPRYRDPLWWMILAILLGLCALTWVVGGQV